MKKMLYLLVVSTMALYALSLPLQVFAAEIILKKKAGKSIEAKVTEVTDKKIKIESTYALDKIKTVNGIPDINQAKIKELAKLGHEYVENEKYAEAFDTLKKIEELDPSNVEIVTDITTALNKLEKYAEALPYALRGIEMDPQDGDAWRRLGDAYRHDGTKEKEAVAAYEKAIELQGPNPVNQFDMGITYKCYKEYNKSLPYLERALTMEPDSKEIKWYFYTHLGRCYLSLGRHQEAIAAFQEVLKRFPVSEQGKAYHWLSVAYQSLGQGEKAAEYERRAKEILDMKPGKKE